MRILLFGATGMVGQGVLRECLRDERIGHIVAVGRRPIGEKDAKLDEIVLEDIAEIGGSAAVMASCDACLFCVGAPAGGLSEAEYSRLTYDLTLAVAERLVVLNPDMKFLFVSGTGTDSSERGRFMWARVKGRTENALLQLPFKGAFMFRPAFIQPLYGIRPRTRGYQLLYAATAPLYPLLRRVAGRMITTTEQLGRAMIEVAVGGYDGAILENADINELAKRFA